MKVIFIKNVKGTAKKDDIKEVSDGYALNKLIPEGVAIRATDEAIANIKKGQQLSAESEMKKELELRKLLADLKKTESITITGRPHAKNRLYNAVTAQEISHAIQSQHQIFISKDLVLDYQPIHEVGEHDLTIGTKKQSISYKLIIK
jgi:large subunit ribosomal protein L9